MTRMTRKRAEALVEEKWGHAGNLDDEAFVHSLCNSMPIELRAEWNRYWEKINTGNKILAPHYDADWYFGKAKARDFLRLLTVHLFIRHTYKD